jgi:hypothetical protein
LYKRNPNSRPRITKREIQSGCGIQRRESLLMSRGVHSFGDAEASSTSTCGRTTQRMRTNPESRMLGSTENILKLIENNKRKDHACGDKMSMRDLGVNSSLDVTTIR